MSFQPVDISFLGEIGEEVMMQTFGGMNTIGSGSVDLHIDVKNEKEIPISDDDAQLQEYTCDPNPQGNVYLYSKKLTVCDLSLQTKMCEKSFEKLFNNQWRGGFGRGANAQPSTNLIDFAVAQLLKKIQKQLENLIWKGNYDGYTPDPYTEGYLSLCTGFLQQLEEETVLGETKIDGNVVTASNVVTEIQSMLNALPEDIVSNMMFTEMWLHVSPNIYMALKNARIAQSQALEQLVAIKVESQGGREVLYYENIRVNVSFGIPANTMVLARPDRLHVGTDLVSDFGEIQISSDRVLTGRNILMRQDMRLGTLPIFPSEIVFYRPAP